MEDTDNRRKARQGKYILGSRRKRRPYLVEAVVGYILQDNWLHGEHIGKLHLWDVQSTDNVGPPWRSKQDREQRFTRGNPAESYTQTRLQTSMGGKEGGGYRKEANLS